MTKSPNNELCRKKERPAGGSVVSPKGTELAGGSYSQASVEKQGSLHFQTKLLYDQISACLKEEKLVTS